MDLWMILMSFLWTYFKRAITFHHVFSNDPGSNEHHVECRTRMKWSQRFTKGPPPCQSTSSHPRFQLPANKWATGSNSIWHISNVRKMNENRILQVVGEKRWDMHSTTFLFLASNASASLRCFVLLNDLYWANHDQWVTHDPSRNCTSRQRP